MALVYVAVGVVIGALIAMWALKSRLAGVRTRLEKREAQFNETRQTLEGTLEQLKGVVRALPDRKSKDPQGPYLLEICSLLEKLDTTVTGLPKQESQQTPD